MRAPDIEKVGMNPEQKRIFDEITAGPRGGVRGPLRVWLHSHAFAEKAQDFGAFCRYGSSLPPRLSELAILTTAAHWKASYEWQAHAPIAEKAGVPKAAIEALRDGGKPHFEDEDQAALHAFASELLATRRVAQATYDRAAEALGTAALVDLVGVLGYYSMISMTINAFEVDPKQGEPDPFA